jgi:hypothetical protein
VNFLDILCASDIRDFLTARGRQTLLVRSDFVAFGSLREGPSVLIGGFDNVWTMQLTTSLRYYLVRDGDTLEIRDHNDVKQVWSLSEDADLSQLKVDYALLGRFRSPDTQQITYLASGLGQYGTVAAARFLDEPKLFLAVETQLHRKIGDDNFEAIVSTDIIKGSASTPRILAVHTWR